MNTHEYDETLYQVAAETLESLALMFLVSEEESPQADAACPKRAAVTFTGPFSGMLVLGASDGVLSELAGNMLGLPDMQVATPAQQEDGLKELTNVVCGNLLPAVAGDQPIFHISAPHVVERQGQVSSDHLLAGAARLHAEAGTIELEFFVDERSPATV